MVKTVEVKVPSEKESYIKTYRMQATGAGGKTIRTSVPSEVVEKEARRREMTTNEFVKHFNVQWLFNGFEGAWAKFVPKDHNAPVKEAAGDTGLDQATRKQLDQI